MQVGTEPEAFVQDGIAVVRLVHVVVDLGEGNVEVQIVLEDDAVEEHEEDSKRSILELGQLDVHRPEFHTPADVGVGRRRLEPHCLPVGRLNVLQCHQNKRRKVSVMRSQEEEEEVEGEVQTSKWSELAELSISMRLS